MNILGLMKTTLLDYPGVVASTIFLGGCNMRCPFCHNMNLVLGDNITPYSVEDIYNHLRKRQGIIEGVCITGGEPTLYPDLPDFIRTIKSFDLKVKLDTNGTNPLMLNCLINEGLIDYVAMDIKSSLSSYPSVCGISTINLNSIEESINLLKNNNIPYEFRTTIIKQYHTPEVINEIGQLLAGSTNYYLQNYTDSEYVPDHSLVACDYNTLLSYKKQLSTYIDNVQIRGVSND